MNLAQHLWTLMPLLTATARKVDVFQSPPSIETVEGETVSLLCTYNTTHEGIGAFIWYKTTTNGTGDAEVTNTSTRYSGRILKVDRASFLSNRNASITITNVTRDDSGTYFCQVEMVLVEKVRGPGTILTVKYVTRPESSRMKWRSQLIVLGVKLAAFLVTIVVTIAFTYICVSRDVTRAERLNGQAFNTRQ